MAGTGYTEYRVKLAKVGDKKYHVMRFKPPHKCDLEKLVNPTLDRQVVQSEEDNIPKAGEGSEFGRRWKEEARKRKRGIMVRQADPDDQPWVLREQKRGGKHFVGRKEGTVNTSSSFYILSVGQDGAFEAYPIQNWYDFVPPVKYNYLKADEAEERFERRNKTLNLFSVMLSKKLRDQEGEEREGGVGEGGEGSSGGGGGRSKKLEEDIGLLLTDSDDSSVDEEDKESPSKSTSDPKTSKGQKRRKKSHPMHSGSEAGEETDEGDLESREVDYMSDSSSGLEHEFQVKQAIKDAPKDDEEVERNEEGEIDKGFTESSSSSEEELTEEGKEIKALMSKQSGRGDSSAEEEESVDAVEKPPEVMAVKSKGGSRPATPDTGDLEKRVSKKDSSKKKSSKRALELSEGSTASPKPSPAKKPKVESTSTITEDEVQRYLSRRPITSKDLVKKFTSKKTDMHKNKIVEVLGQIIQRMKNVDRQTIKGKLYLSLKA